MLNKQNNDPDVAGIGSFVEENFVNVGIGDHPIQALNALAKGHLDPTKLGSDGFPYHAEDIGRAEITHDMTSDAYKLRVLTMRQLADGRNYFNAGVRQDPPTSTSPSARTLSTSTR
jgi:hypothetical protein